MFREIRSDFPELSIPKESGGVRGAAEPVDIRPACPAPVIRCVNGHLRMDEDVVWGFPVKGTLLINARSETASALPAFRASVRARRCLIPAAGFYERDREKNPVSFTRDGRDVLYLAGFYNLFPEGERFLILTTAANASMAPVHDRMPLMIEPGEAVQWLDEWNCAERFMRNPMPEVRAHRKYEQQTFDFL